MYCSEVRDLADSFIADELLTETNHAIVRHLDVCAGCRKEIGGRRALRLALREAFERTSDLKPRAEFVAQLERTVHALAAGPPRRRPAFARWLPVAASLLLLSAGGFLVNNARGRAEGLTQAALGDHRNCALHFRLSERPISLAAAAQRYGRMFAVFDQVPAPETATLRGPAHVLERHACVYHGRRFAHVVLRYGGTVVSLLAAPGESAPPAGTIAVEGTSIVTLHAGGQVVFLIADMPPADLQSLADALSDGLIQHLRGV